MRLFSLRRVYLFRALSARPFLLLWLGQTISALGDGAFITALAWQVLLLTGSATAMGIVVTAETIPRLLFLLLGGVMADRLPRRLVMLYADWGRGILVLLIALAGWLHLLQFWHLVIVSLLFGIGTGCFMPAYRAIPPQLVDVEMLPSANALGAFSQQVSMLLGPLLGAGLIALTGPAGAFAFDGLSFVISAGCLLLMRQPLSESAVLAEAGIERIATLRGRLQDMGRDLRAGWRFVIGAKWFWIGLPIALLGNLFFSGAIDVALPRLVHDVYGRGVTLLGALGAASAFGSIAATLLVGQMAHLPRRGLVAYLAVLLASVAEGILGLPLPYASAPVIACLASACLGFGLGAFGIIWVTLMQELVPQDMLGRVSSIDQLGAWSLLPIGFALTGIATDHIGPAAVFLLAGAMNVVLAIIALLVPDIRDLR